MNCDRSDRFTLNEKLTRCRLSKVMPINCLHKLVNDNSVFSGGEQMSQRLQIKTVGLIQTTLFKTSEVCPVSRILTYPMTSILLSSDTLTPLWTREKANRPDVVSPWVTPTATGQERVWRLSHSDSDSYLWENLSHLNNSPISHPTPAGGIAKTHH